MNVRNAIPALKSELRNAYAFVPVSYIYTPIFSVNAEDGNEIFLTVYFICIALEMEQSPFTLEFVSLWWNKVY